MTEQTNNSVEAKPVAETKAKAALIRNLIFAVFIIVALLFCFKQFNKGQKIKELNRAIELLNQAREASPVDYTSVKLAEQIFENFSETDFTDEETIRTYVTSKSLCYSTLGDMPDLSASESQKYYMKAYTLDESNPDIPELMRLQFKGMSLKEAAGEAVESATAAAKAAAAEVKEAAGEAFESAKAAAKEAAGEVKEAAGEVLESAKAAAKEAGDQAKEAVEAVTEAAEKAAE